MNTAKIKVACKYFVYIPVENFESRLYLGSDKVCVHKIVHILSEILPYSPAYSFPKIVLLLQSLEL